MSEYTPITGELREAMVRWGWCESDGTITVSSTPPNIEAEPFLTIAGSRFDHLCDAIDSVHAALEAENERYRDGWVELPKDGEAPNKQLAEWIESRGLVTGPLDADGELWHRGDMSDSPWGEIESIAFDGYHWQVSGHDTSAPWIPADSISHYHAPTVEDVLREMLDAWGELPSNKTNDAIVAKYAKRLTLAGDAE